MLCDARNGVAEDMKAIIPTDFCHHCLAVVTMVPVQGTTCTFWECCNCRCVMDIDFDDEDEQDEEHDHTNGEINNVYPS